MFTLCCKKERLEAEERNLMKKKKLEEKNNSNQEDEKQHTYGSETTNKTIHFFSTFKEAEEYGYKEMASHTYLQRLNFLEILRKRIYNDKLTPDGKWFPLERTLTIISATLK